MKIIYAGNRSFALKNFGKKFKNEISIFAIKNSFLEKYAEIGFQYVTKVKDMIKRNQLSRYANSKLVVF